MILVTSAFTCKNRKERKKENLYHISSTPLTFGFSLLVVLCCVGAGAGVAVGCFFWVGVGVVSSIFRALRPLLYRINMEIWSPYSILFCFLFLDWRY